MARIQNIYHPHDKFVKRILYRQGKLEAFFQATLPTALLQQLDFSTFRVLRNETVTENLGLLASDILALCDLKTGETCAFCFLFEHKSYPERRIHFQLLSYMNAIWEEILENNKDLLGENPQKFAKLPIITPVVVYHGKEPWNYPTELQDFLVSKNSIYQKYVPNFSYEFIKITPELFSLFQKEREILLLLKTLYYQSMKNLQEHYEEVLQLCIDQNGNCDFKSYRILLSYCMNVSHASDKKFIKCAQKVLGQQGEGMAMTMAEQLRKEGAQEAQKQFTQALKDLEEKRLQEEAKRKEEEAKRKEEEAKRKEEEAKRKEEETKRKEETQKQFAQTLKDLEEKLLQEETKRKEEETKRKDIENRIKKNIIKTLKSKYNCENILILNTILNLKNQEDIIETQHYIYECSNYLQFEKYLYQIIEKQMVA